jgi:hypothetical protein
MTSNECLANQKRNEYDWVKYAFIFATDLLPAIREALAGRIFISSSI